MSIRVLAPGLLATVQDCGRVGRQQEGVPVSGAMDPLALRLANLLVGNDQGAAGLEMALLGATLRFDAATVVALAGGDMRARVADDPVPRWRPVWLPAGAVLAFHAASLGAHGYLAVAGGIDVPDVLGARATYVRGGFGGVAGRALQRDDVIATGQPSPRATRIGSLLGDTGTRPRIASWGIGPSLVPAYTPAAIVRLIPGPQLSRLAPASIDRLFTADFRISSQSDRMGYRLEGPTIELAEPLELLSSGVTFGTVQLPPGGHPIVLMADRQTTGGYPRIGEIASVDLPLVAQLKPGDHLRFRRTSVDDAQELYLRRETDIAQAACAIGLTR